MPWIQDEFGNIIQVGAQQNYNEFDAYSDDLAEAAVAPNGGVNSDIQQYANFSKLQEERNNDETVPVSISPTTIRKNFDPKLGDMTEVASGEPPVEVVRWEGKVQEATAVTVNVSIQQNYDGSFQVTNGAANRPYAIIKWGIRNCVSVITVDVCKNLQLNLVASAVYVSVGLDPGDDGKVGTMSVGASLGFFGTSKSGPCTRTIYLGSIPPIGPDGPFHYLSGIIPAGARTLSSVQSNPISSPPAVIATLGIDILDIAGNTIAQFGGGNTSAPVLSSPFVLPNDAYSFKVWNYSSSGTTINSVRLVFDLAF
jgi:hypothetical protein